MLMVFDHFSALPPPLPATPPPRPVGEEEWERGRGTVDNRSKTVQTKHKLDPRKINPGGRFKGLKNMCLLSRPGPREPPKPAGSGGPTFIFGLSWEIIGFRNRGGGPVGHPQGVQVKTLILNIKCLQHHVTVSKIVHQPL